MEAIILNSLYNGRTRMCTSFDDVYKRCLMTGVRRGHLDVIMCMSCRVNAQVFNKAFELACAKGKTKTVDMFLHLGIKQLNNGLIKASEYGHLEVVKLLLTKAEDVPEKALTFAVDKGYFDILHLLITKAECLQCSCTCCHSKWDV